MSLRGFVRRRLQAEAQWKHCRGLPRRIVAAVQMSDADFFFTDKLSRRWFISCLQSLLVDAYSCLFFFILSFDFKDPLNSKMVFLFSWMFDTIQTVFTSFFSLSLSFTSLRWRLKASLHLPEIWVGDAHDLCRHKYMLIIHGWCTHRW